MDATKRFIKVLGGFEGIHQWKSAPEEVGYLSHPHRHWFGVVVWIEVEHYDRNIEFYMFKKELSVYLRRIVARMKSDSSWSCEKICDELAGLIRKDYPNRELRIEVTEDNLEGAECHYAKA